MQRVTAVWSGFIGSPGYSNFYFESIGGDPTEAGASANVVTARVRTFFDNIKTYLPQTVTVTVQPGVQQIDEATGTIEEEATATDVLLPVSGADGAGYSAPSGICVSWRTGTFVAGKRLRGRTFLVPAGRGAYQEDGTLTGFAVSQITEHANTLRGDGIINLNSLVVWHRPVGGVGGSTGRVTAATVADKAAVLRSRRD